MKTAFVTGGRRGIGLAIARALAGDGFRVVVSGRSEDPGDGGFPYIRCDNGDGNQIRAAMERLLALGGVDVLVNNAAMAPRTRADLLETTEESFDEVLAVNLKGTFLWCQLAARAMAARKAMEPGYRPRIINISSVSAYASSVNRGEYCISKAGVSMVTKLFADRLAQHDIPVFEVRPGIIVTDMTRAVKEGYERRIHEGLTPLRRLGTPEDVARCVLPLARGDFDFATGQVIDADGGFHLRRL